MSKSMKYKPTNLKHRGKIVRQSACTYCKGKKIKVRKHLKGSDGLAHLNIAMASAKGTTMGVLQHANNARDVISSATYRRTVITTYRLDGIPQL